VPAAEKIEELVSGGDGWCGYQGELMDGSMVLLTTMERTSGVALPYLLASRMG